MAVSTGYDMAQQNAIYMREESAFLVDNNSGLVIHRPDFQTGGNAFQRMQEWVEHTADGFTSAQGRALTSENATVSGTWAPHYRSLEHVLRGICGAPTTDTTIDGGTRRKLVFAFPKQGAPSVATYGVWYVPADLAIMSCGGILTALDLTTQRNGGGGTVSGNISYMFARVKEPIAVPGSVAINEVKMISAAGATGSASIVLPATKLGAGGTLTIALGASQSTVQTAIRAMTGYNTTVTVVGSSVAGSAGTPEVQTIDFDSVADGPVAITFNGSTRYFNASGDANDVRAALESIPDIGAGKVSVSGTLTYDDSGSQTYSGTYTVTFNASLGNVGEMSSITAGIDINTTTPGVASVAATGSYVITFAGTLAHYDVPDWPATGGNGWTQETVTNGSDGADIYYYDSESPYLEASHAMVYKADDDADLATIDMTDLPDAEDDDGDPHLLRTAVTQSVNFADLFTLFYPLTGKRYATDFVGGAQTITSSVTLPYDLSTGSDYDYFLNTQNGCVASSFWMRYRWTCGMFDFWIDMYAGRTSAPTLGSDNNVLLATIEMGRIHNPEDTGDLFATLILPV